jgi:hypothetical protein
MMRLFPCLPFFLRVLLQTFLTSMLHCFQHAGGSTSSAELV